MKIRIEFSISREAVFDREKLELSSILKAIDHAIATTSPVMLHGAHSVFHPLFGGQTIGTWAIDDEEGGAA